MCSSVLRGMVVGGLFRDKTRRRMMVKMAIWWFGERVSKESVKNLKGPTLMLAWTDEF